MPGADKLEYSIRGHIHGMDCDRYTCPSVVEILEFGQSVLLITSGENSVQ